MSQLPKTSVEHHERRNSPRYPVRVHAALEYSENSWDVHLLDISATGAQLAILDDYQLNPNDELTLTIEMEELPEGLLNVPLQLRGRVVHTREHIVGLALMLNNETENEKLHLWLGYFTKMNL